MRIRIPEWFGLLTWNAPWGTLALLSAHAGDTRLAAGELAIAGFIDLLELGCRCGLLNAGGSGVIVYFRRPIWRS